MNWVDGFVTSVRNANREAQQKRVAYLSRRFSAWGALKAIECRGSDWHPRLIEPA